MEQDGNLNYGEDSDPVTQMTTIVTPSPKIQEQRYNRIKIGWPAVPGAEKYEVYYSLIVKMGNLHMLVLHQI